MGILIEPNIKVDDIEIEMDKHQSGIVERIMNEWGKSIPIVKINNYVLNAGDLLGLSVSTTLNNLPRFSLSVNDSKYKIREALIDDIDRCTIFIGYKEWYIKFNGIISTTHSDAGDTIIYMEGWFYQEPLYRINQLVYSDMPLRDILTDLCDRSKMGLYVFDNQSLNQIISKTICPNKNILQYISEVISRYTDNIFMFDTFGYLHVGDVDTIRKQPISKYTLNNKGEQSSPKDMIFQTYKYGIDDDDKDKIKCGYYTFDTNFTEKHVRSNAQYLLSDETSNVILHEDLRMGFDNVGTNTFSGFKNNKKPYYANIVNKNIGGNSIKLELQNLMFEISPFDMVELECYIPDENHLSGLKLDTEHSGKKMLIGFDLNYIRATQSENFRIVQTLNLI